MEEELTIKERLLQCHPDQMVAFIVVEPPDDVFGVPPMPYNEETDHFDLYNIDSGYCCIDTPAKVIAHLEMYGLEDLYDWETDTMGCLFTWYHEKY